MKYAVLGSAGQLGRDLMPLLPGDVVGLTRERADLTRPESLENTLRELRPDWVINCAAYNYVDRAESEPEAAFAVNAWGVRQVAKLCRDLSCGLVHFSTDYVFGLDPNHATPFTPCDAPGPVSVYGLSKLAGEYLVRSLCPNHLVLRTCGLYGVWGTGGKGGNFVETMLKVAAQGKPLRVVSDQQCTPSYTADVAAATVGLLEMGCRGLYHVTNSGSCSWYEFAREIFHQEKVQANLSPISSQEYGATAQRPAYSVLTNATDGTLPPLRSWKEALGAYLRQRRQK